MKNERMAFPSTMVFWKKAFLQKTQDPMVLWDMCNTSVCICYSLHKWVYSFCLSFCLGFPGLLEIIETFSCVSHLWILWLIQPQACKPGRVTKGTRRGSIKDSQIWCSPRKEVNLCQGLWSEEFWGKKLINIESRDVSVWQVKLQGQESAL